MQMHFRLLFSLNYFFIKALFSYYLKILLGIMSKLYNIHGTNIIKPITMGNKIVQENSIN